MFTFLCGKSSSMRHDNLRPSKGDLQRLKKRLRSSRHGLEWVKREIEGALRVEGVEEEGLMGPLMGMRWLIASAHQALEVLQSQVEELLKQRPLERRFLKFLRSQEGFQASKALWELAQELSASRKAVIQTAWSLERKGKIRVIRPGRGQGRKNTYQLVEGHKTCDWRPMQHFLDSSPWEWLL